MNILANILISAVVGIGTLIGAYNFLPLGAFEYFSVTGEPKVGATITTIQSTDTLRDSRSTINTNFTNLNTDKIENSTTSVASITTLANLVTVGTITSGTWNGATVGLAYGGTGTTTICVNKLLAGNGTTNIQCIGGGTAGDFLQFGSPPAWAAGTVNQSATYNWLAGHTFVFSTTTRATTTVLEVTQVASTSQLIIGGGLGVGKSTTTSGSIEIANDIQVGDDAIVAGDCIGCGAFTWHMTSANAANITAPAYVGHATSSAVAQIVSFVAPATSTARNLWVRCKVDTTASNAVITLYQNGSATSLTTTIDCDTAVGTGTDYVNTVTINRGDLLDIYLNVDQPIRYYDISLLFTGVRY